MNTQYINGVCINTVLINFPTTKIKGCVTKNDDESYTIFLNAKLDYFTMKKTFEHELKHIFNNDFEKFDVDEIETQAH